MTRVSGPSISLYSLYLNIQSSHTLDPRQAVILTFYIFIWHTDHIVIMFCLSPCFCICAFYDILPLTQTLDTSSPSHMTWLETGDDPPKAGFLPVEGGAWLISWRGQYSGLELWAPSLICLGPAWTPAIRQCLVQADVALKILISLPSLVFVSSWFAQTIACHPD